MVIHRQIIQGTQQPGQLHIVHVLVEFMSKGQTLQVQWPPHIVHVLVECVTKGEILQCSWQLHIVHVLVEIMSKCQALQSHWQCQAISKLIQFGNFLIECWAKLQFLYVAE